jgi:hypothetical protein
MKDKLTEDQYLEYMLLLQETFEHVLTDLGYTPETALELRNQAKRELLEAKRNNTKWGWNKAENTEKKLCLDWWLSKDYVKQFQKDPDSWSPTQKDRAERMVNWNKHISKRWKGYGLYGKIFQADIV